tara:strand:- start:34 stop:378 length:345 start_codon:yes stop_codon:yes gene_type:complete
MSLEKFVLGNQKILELVRDKVPGRDDVDMYYGTLDYATARFHTILLKLSQDKILEADNIKEVEECFNAIQDFYKNVEKYRWGSWWTKPFIKIVLHRIGTKRIPKIKKLLQKLDN